MRYILKIVFVFALLTLSAMAQDEKINECKSDLYYANGIMGETEDKMRVKWQFTAKKLLSVKPETYVKIVKIRISYNISQFFLDDLIESFEQVMNNEWGWVDFTAFYAVFLTEVGIQEDWRPHINDLTKQVNSYKQSIKDGHGVVVIAHSQGNYFTNEAYELLDPWMKPYFKMMGVATPANHVAGFEAGDTTAPYVKFHNDFIKIVVTGLSSNRDDPNPNHNGTISVSAHDFYDSYLMAENTKGEILGFIETKIEEHTTAPSQWETNEEFELNTCDYKITVKHRHDPDNIIMDDMVYPFAPAKKLYQVNGEWVKASCGGENILDQWDEKKENECWLIDNPEEEKIINRKLTRVASYYGYYHTIGSTGFSYSKSIAYASIRGRTVLDDSLEKVVNVAEQQFDTCQDKLFAAKEQLIIAKEYAQNYLEKDILKVEALYPKYIIQYEFEEEYFFQEKSCSCDMYPNGNKTCYGLIIVGVDVYK